jgi:hypothetical protein
MPPSLTFADRFGCLIPDTLADSDDHSHSSDSADSVYETDDTSMDQDDYNAFDNDDDDDDDDDYYDDHSPIAPTGITACAPSPPVACPITGVECSDNNGNTHVSSDASTGHDDVSSAGKRDDESNSNISQMDQDGDITGVDQDGDITGVDSNNEDNDGAPSNLDADMDQRYGIRNHDINLRPRKERTYDFCFDHQQYITFDEPFGLLFLTEQMSLKQGLKLFGKKGAKAVIAEL